MDLDFLSFFRTPLKYGAIIGFIYLIQINVQHLLRTVGFELDPYSPYIALFFLSIGLFLGLGEHSKNTYDGRITYLEGLRTGLLITVIATFFSCLFMYVYSEYINFDWPDIQAEKLRRELSELGTPKIEIHRKMAAVYYKFSTTSRVKHQLIINMIGGSCLALIIPLLAKRVRSGKKYSSRRF